jgi:hypothetical protein
VVLLVQVGQDLRELYKLKEVLAHFALKHLVAQEVHQF